MEQAIKILVYIHAFFGGIGLISGLIAISVKKGGVNHRRTGKIFSRAMVISSLLSLFIARMPGHENLFLFLIGVFTIYMVLSGNRALSFKGKQSGSVHWMDKSTSGTMLMVSVMMLLMGFAGLISQAQNKVLYIFFGSFGLFMTLRDFNTFRIFSTDRKAWLVHHIGRMVGALIASVTAFMVAGLNIGSVLAWITPSIIGTAYIVYWSKKYRSGKVEPV